MPPAGAEARGELRATVGRLAHERFTDERVGELLETAAPRDEVEADVVRVARRDYDKARRVPASSSPRWRAPGSRRAGPGCRRARAATSRRSCPTWSATSSCAGAIAPASPRPSMPTTRCSTTTSRACARPICARSSSACATASSRWWPRPPRGRRRGRCARGRSPRPASARWSTPCCAPSASTTASGASTRPTHPFEATIAADDVRLTTRYSEADLDSLLQLAARARPRALRAPDRPRPGAHAAGRRRLERVARVAEPAVGEHGRALGGLLALVPAARAGGAARALRRRDAGRRSSRRPTPCARASSA